jgi:hypothetical protein
VLEHLDAREAAIDPPRDRLGRDQRIDAGTGMEAELEPPWLVIGRAMPDEAADDVGHELARARRGGEASQDMVVGRVRVGGEEDVGEDLGLPGLRGGRRWLGLGAFDDGHRLGLGLRRGFWFGRRRGLDRHHVDVLGRLGWLGFGWTEQRD